MGTINAALNGVFDAIFLGLGLMPAILGLFIVSVAFGILALLVFGKVSNQAGIRRAKDKIQCNLFLIRLYKDELGITFRAMSRVFVQLFPYLGHNVMPVFVLIVPFFVVCAQLNAHYGYSALLPGDRPVVTIGLAEGTDLSTVEIVPGDGVVLDSRLVRIPSRNEVSARLRIEKQGEPVITVNADGESIEKKVNARSGVHRVSHLRSANWVDLLLYPGEAALPGTTVEWVSVDTPLATMAFLGLDLHWIIWFLILSMVAAFALKGVFGVEI
jgi:hypothetical protein